MSNRATAYLFYGIHVPWTEEKDEALRARIKKLTGASYDEDNFDRHTSVLLAPFRVGVEHTGWDSGSLLIYVLDTTHACVDGDKGGGLLIPNLNLDPGMFDRKEALALLGVKSRSAWGWRLHACEQ